MKNIFLILLSFAILFASEDVLDEKYPQKKSHLTKEELKILEQSLEEHYKQDRQYQHFQQRTSQGNKSKHNQQEGGGVKNNDFDKRQNSYNTLKEELQSKGGIKNPNNRSTKDEREENIDAQSYQSSKQKRLKGSIKNGVNNPYLGMIQENLAKEEDVEIIKNQKWIYGISVITTTFLDGSIKRSYGVLLKDGLFLTSANMVYDKNIYPRESYAMMQDDSSIPFICVAKLSIKALDLQRGLAILETSSYTDMYCNPERKSFYHDRIYSKHWVDVFEKDGTNKQGVVYSPYISDLNSFYTRRSIVEDTLEVLAKEESRDFEGYKYAYGKGYFTFEGKLIGVVGASQDEKPKLMRREEIADFLCELKEKKILQTPYLQKFCPN